MFLKNMNKSQSIIFSLFLIMTIACIGMIAYIIAINTNPHSNSMESKNKPTECLTKACLKYGLFLFCTIFKFKFQMLH